MIPTTPPELATWLATARTALLVDAYTIIATNGTTVRWIDADFDYTLPDGRGFGRGPLIERSSIKQAVGLSVDTMDLSLWPVFDGQPVAFGAQTLLQAAQRGTLRGATLQLERLVFATSPSDYQGSWIECAGTLSVRNTAGGVIRAQVLSELNLLAKPMPADVYQTPCRNQVFDVRCGLSRAAWTVAGTVASVSSGSANRVQFGTALAQAASHFSLGVLRFTSGANAGERRTVKSFASGNFTFALPWPQVVAVGDAFEVIPGCDRTLATCGSKFSNVLRYRGEPFLPAPETLAS